MPRSRKKKSLVGGPADGAATTRGDVFIFATADVIAPEPFPGGELYRLTGKMTYDHAEPELGRCLGCGAFVKRPLRACPLCGGVTQPRGGKMGPGDDAS